jgi:hypothetical protein
MSEMIPETAITEPEVAVEVAYSAKKFRDLAAAIRLMSSIQKDAETVELPSNADDKRTPYERAVAVSDRISKAHLAFPEVLGAELDVPHTMGAFALGKKLDKAFLRLRDATYRTTFEFEKDYDKSDKGIDEYAKLTEDITEALIVNPPSQDFIKDFAPIRFTDDSYTTTDQRLTAETVIDNFRDAGLSQKSLDHIVGDSAAIWDGYSVEGSETENSKTDVMQSFNTMFIVYTTGLRGNHDKTIADIEKQVRTAMDSETTTDDDLWRLFDSCTAIILKALEEQKDGQQYVYDAVMSGEASEYKSPIEEKA